MPEMVTEFVALEPSDKPGVSEPAEIVQLKGGTPPEELMVAE